MSEYAGESIAKKVCRIRLYKRTRQALKYFGYKLEHIKVLFLPGPDSTEIGALKHILKVQPTNVCAVDRDPQVCEDASDRWPGISAVCGDLRDSGTLETVRDISSTYDFIHLDLMGTLSGASVDLYSRWGWLCETNGVLAVTYLRGREQKISTLSRNCQNIATAAMDMWKNSKGEGKKLFKLMSADPERSYAHLLALKISGAMGVLKFEEKVPITDWLETDPDPEFVEQITNQMINEDHRYGSFTPLATHAYRADFSSMGVLAVQKVYDKDLQSGSYGKLRYDNSRHTMSIIRKDPMDELLQEADSLEKEFSKDAAAEILGVSKGTLAAWRAHRTMGTYD